MKSRTADKRQESVNFLALADYVDEFSKKTAVLLGDFVADEFQFAEISRVSREAPVLILRHRTTEYIPGGGANAANNLAALGARVLPVSVVGDDAAGMALLGHFQKIGVDVSEVQVIPGRLTPTKTRIVAGWPHTVGQQVLRVDREPNTKITAANMTRLQRAVIAKSKKADLLSISDYGFGTANPVLVRAASKARGKKIPVTLDARRELHAYAGCGVTAATPNESELEEVHHTAIGNSVENLERLGRSTRECMGLDSLLVTRGRHGMTLFQAGSTEAHIAVHGSDEAVDVTGAGDTVLAVYSLGLACGASPFEAAQLANIAGGLVVMKRGTATVTQAELLEAIHREVTGAK